jgi:hypothetical protein
VGKGFTAGAYVVNGWNTFCDNNSGKTIRLLLNATNGRFSVNNNYLTGAKQPQSTAYRRSLFDTTGSQQQGFYPSEFSTLEGNYRDGRL